MIGHWWLIQPSPLLLPKTLGCRDWKFQSSNMVCSPDNLPFIHRWGPKVISLTWAKTPLFLSTLREFYCQKLGRRPSISFLLWITISHILIRKFYCQKPNISFLLITISHILISVMNLTNKILTEERCFRDIYITWLNLLFVIEPYVFWDICTCMIKQWLTQLQDCAYIWGSCGFGMGSEGSSRTLVIFYFLSEEVGAYLIFIALLNCICTYYYI